MLSLVKMMFYYIYMFYPFLFLIQYKLLWSLL